MLNKYDIDNNLDYKQKLSLSFNRLIDLYQNTGKKEEMDKVELEIKNLSV